MKCPVCGKHVTRERYDVHVEAHAPAAPADDAPTVEAPSRGIDSGAGETLVAPDEFLLPTDLLPAPGRATRVTEPAGAEETVGADEPADGGVAAPAAAAPAAEPAGEPPPGAQADWVPEDEAGPEEPAPDEAGDDTVAVDTLAFAGEDGEASPRHTVVSTTPIDEITAGAPTMDEPRNPWGSPGGVVALPPLPPGPTRRRRTSALPIVGLVVLAIAAGVLAYVFSSHHKTKTTNASAVKTTTTLRSPFGAATPASPFAAPGFTAPSTFPTTFSTLPPGILPGAPGAPAAAAPVDTSKFLVSPSGAVCENGGMTVNGTIRNNGATRATVNFTVRVVDASGATLGAAQATAPALAPGEQRSFAATGQCTGTLGGGDRAIPVVDSATAA